MKTLKIINSIILVLAVYCISFCISKIIFYFGIESIWSSTNAYFIVQIIGYTILALLCIYIFRLRKQYLSNQFWSKETLMIIQKFRYFSIIYLIFSSCKYAFEAIKREELTQTEPSPFWINMLIHFISEGLLVAVFTLLIVLLAKFIENAIQLKQENDSII